MSAENVANNEDLRQRIVAVLKTVYDPEIPVDIYELGLIYDIVFDDAANVRIVMTLTSPGCPVAVSLPVEVENRVKTLDGLGDVTVDVVWDPPWTPDKMSEAARLELDM